MTATEIKASKSGNDEQPEAGFAFIHTAGFPDLLRRLGISLIVTTYQAKRLMTLSPKGEKLHLHMRIFEPPTGMAVQNDRLALYARNQVWLFKMERGIRDLAGNPQPHDLYIAPRMSFVTGDIAGHEMAFAGDHLLLINTRFSCTCTLSPDHSFIAGWRPPFISKVEPEDRCHLNGFAVDSSGPRFYTAVAQTDTKEGWREHKRDGGIVIDAASGEIITRGLSMPHSPRLYNGRLWVLDSGRGELQLLDLASGKRASIARFPGFLRGLCFFGNYAFVGLSRIRETRTFGDLEVESLFPELECAIYCVDLSDGKTTGFVKFTKGIEELFDVQVLPGASSPYIVGFKDETVDGLFILPPGQG